MTWHPDIPLEYRNQIVTGDARELAKRMPDESIDLILTDPPYPKEYLHCFYEMGEWAPRVLKPGGSLITLLGHWQIPYIFEALSGLKYHWFGWMVHGQKSTSMAFRTVRGGKPFVWYSRGQPKIHHGFFWDTKIVGKRDKRFHEWGQPVEPAIRDIECLCAPDAIVLDPFVGGGTTAAACKITGRNYIAFEIDPETADLARERVLNTQPPLFVPEPEQLEFE